MMASVHGRARGFTVLELMVTIAVLAILLTVAVPSFTNIINNNRVSSAANALVTAMNYTRSEAISRGTVVRLCPANSALNNCADSDDWDGPLLVRVQQGAAAGEVLRVWEALASQIDLDLETDDVVSDNHIDFLPMGNVAIDGPDFEFQLILKPQGCVTGRPFQRKIDLRRTGRAQVITEDC